MYKTVTDHDKPDTLDFVMGKTVSLRLEEEGWITGVLVMREPSGWIGIRTGDGTHYEGYMLTMLDTPGKKWGK